MRRITNGILMCIVDPVLTLGVGSSYHFLDQIKQPTCSFSVPDQYRRVITNTYKRCSLQRVTDQRGRIVEGKRRGKK